MISACIFDLEGVILEPGRLPDLPAYDGLLSPGSAEESRWLKAVHHLMPDDLRDGVFIFIKELKNKGLNLAVVSCCPYLREILNRLQIRHYFHAFLEGGGAVPATELYDRAAELLGVSASKVVVFAGSEAGIDAARAAGCRTVGIGNVEGLSRADLSLPTLERARFSKILSAIGEEEE
ncbi:MAG: HAD family hydrolase [Saprospiraceae bacterium]